MQFNVKNINIVFKFLSLGAAILAAVFWTGAEVETRSKNNDEQTLIGGAIWSQTIITIGLIISAEVDDYIDPFVEGYFLFCTITLLLVTGIILITIEYKKMRNRQQPTNVIEITRTAATSARINSFDQTYLTIGAFCILSGVFAIVDFIFMYMTRCSI